MAVTATLVKKLRDKTGAGMMDCKRALVECNESIEQATDWLREKGISKAEKKASRISAEGLCQFVEVDSKIVVFELNSETDFVAKNEKFLSLLEKVGNIIVSSDAVDTDAALAIDVDGKSLKDVLVDATVTIGENITLRRVSVISKDADKVYGSYKHMGGKIICVTTLEGSDAETAKDIAMHVAAINPKYLDKSEISDAIVEKEKDMLTKEALAEGKPANIVEKMVIGRLNKYLKEICLVNQPFVKNPDMNVEKYVASKNGKIVSYLRLEVGEGIEKKEDNFAEEVMSQVNK